VDDVVAYLATLKCHGKVIERSASRLPGAGCAPGRARPRWRRVAMQRGIV